MFTVVFIQNSVAYRCSVTVTLHVPVILQIFYIVIVLLNFLLDVYNPCAANFVIAEFRATIKT